MTTNVTSQQFESYIPVYDTVPEKWEDARPFMVEMLKKMTNSLNSREIGYFIDDEVISGKLFIPTSSMSSNNSSNSQQFTTVLRKVVITGALVAGVNPPIAHGVVFDANFTLVDLWVAGTNSATFTARVISGNDVIMDATNLNITSPQAFDRSYAIIEYIQEI